MEFIDDVHIRWESLSSLSKETISQYNAKFWVAYLQVTPFKKVSTKCQLQKYQGGFLPTIQAFVSIHTSSKLQDLMQVAKVVEVMKEDMLKA